MKSGLYAVASLDGAPVSERDLRAVGLDAQHREGLAVHAADLEENGRAASVLIKDDGAVAFVGHLDEPTELAATLGAPTHTPVAELALAALDRCGDDAPARMLGEWSLLRWHAPSCTLTLLASEACRDPMFFASDGKRVAIAPQVRTLARLDWVDAAFDPKGLPLQLSRARLRRIMAGETFLRGITRIVPGTREVFSLGGRRTSHLPAPLPPEPWHGSFDDAVAALEDMLRHIVRQHLQRHGTAAFLLSGGLDSSLLSWLGSQERGQDQRMFFLTSVAPEGSGLTDEREFSETVAERLGLPVTFVCPPESASAYTPSARMFAHSELPVQSPRHYLYDALYDAAHAGGVEALFDGAYGELTVTSKARLMPTRISLRQRARDAKAWFRDLRQRYGWPTNAFHVRLSRGALAALPREWASEWGAPYAPDPAPRVDELWGFRPAVRKNAMTPTSAADGRLRHLIPFRDRRLLRLMASMPASFLHHDGMNRALARAMLKDRLPNSVRLRQGGGQFSPDYPNRLRMQAPLARARIDLFRQAGAGDWLDLAWLDSALTRINAGAPASAREPFEVQATTVAAEFFVWWKTEMNAQPPRQDAVQSTQMVSPSGPWPG